MSQNVILDGSHREHPSGSMPVGHPTPDEFIQITLLLRRRNAAPDPAQIETHLTHNQLTALHGADPEDMHAVQVFAAEHNLAVVKTNPAARTTTLSGPVAKLATLFGADLELRSLGNRVIRTRKGCLHLPASLKDRVIAVLGFDGRPVARTNHQVSFKTAQPAAFTVPQLAKLYNFPTNTGIGQTIALIELEGGYNPADLTTYWSQLGLPPVSVTPISVDGAQNAPTGDPNGPDGEVVLDIQVAGSVAPGAKIAVYFAPNTGQGFLDAINAAIHDTERKPSVISISWGSAEPEWTAQALFAYNAAFHDAALLGITVLAAAGDNGSTDGEKTDRHVDFPASSPWVLACGGTRLIAADGKIQSETVWNDGTQGGATGGGVSHFFSQPKYQAHVPVPAPPVKGGNPTGRGVPDIAAVADPETGYIIFLNGEPTVIGGTSAVAPLWAGLFALCNQATGKNTGWPHNFLYGPVAQHKVLHDITTGTNGAYKAAIGWDPCTGLGTPDGQALLGLLPRK